MARRPTTSPRAHAIASCALFAICTVSATSFGREPPDPDPWFSKDKALHFGASAIIAGGGYGVSAPFFEHSRLQPLLIGAGLGVVAGVGKELYDATGAGDPSAKDLVWDGIGITAGLLVAVGIDLLIRGWSLDAKDATGSHEASERSRKAEVGLKPAIAPQGFVVRF